MMLKEFNFYKWEYEFSTKELILNEIVEFSIK